MNVQKYIGSDQLIIDTRLSPWSLAPRVYPFLGLAWLRYVENWTFLSWPVLIALIYFAYRVLYWVCEHVLLTDRRIMRVKGIVVRSQPVIGLGQITNHVHRQHVLQVILGYGTIFVDTAGQEEEDRIYRYLPNSHNFRDKLAMCLYAKR